jgi:methylamine---glutamate N-methyltransferase subunit B
VAAMTPLSLDCDASSTREINRALRALPAGASAVIQNPRGRHNLAVGLTEPIDISVIGNAGYYLGGLGGRRDGTGPAITVEGFTGWGVGENLMGGTIRVHGSVSQSTGSSAHGGLIVVEGGASLRTGISLKGGTVAVAGDSGAMTGFMAQAGTILIGGDAGAGLGDSIYEAVIYVAGSIASLGADAQVEELSDVDIATIKALVEQAGFDHISPGDVTRVASARQLYHFSSEHHGMY